MTIRESTAQLQQRTVYDTMVGTQNAVPDDLDRVVAKGYDTTNGVHQVEDQHIRGEATENDHTDPNPEGNTVPEEPFGPAEHGGVDKDVASVVRESTEATRNQTNAITPRVSSSQATHLGQPHATLPIVRQRLSPKSKAYNRVLVVGLVFGGACAVYISFYSIMSFVMNAGWPPAVAWAFPAFIDIMLIISAGTVLSYKADGKSPWKAWLWLLVFSAASVYANVMHAIALPNSASLWAWGAAGIAALVPVGVFAATELVSDVAIDNPHARTKERAEDAAVEDEELKRQRDRELADAEHQARLSRVHKTSEAQIEAEVHAVRESIGHRPTGGHTAGQGTGQATGESGRPWTSDRPFSRDQDTTSRQSTPRSGSSSGTVSGSQEDLAPLDEVERVVRQRTAQGLNTKPKDVQEYLGLGPQQSKTCYRRLKVLIHTKPEIFPSEETP